MLESKHVIEIEYDDKTDRAYWQCGCGHSGSCRSYVVDVQAEKHVPEGESISYRYLAE